MILFNIIDIIRHVIFILPAVFCLIPAAEWKRKIDLKWKLQKEEIMEMIQSDVI